MVTKLKDMIVPARFADYTAEKAVEKNIFFRSGIARNHPDLNSVLKGGGKTTVMPFVKPLSGDSQIPSEDDDMEVNTIKTSNDLARRQFRVNAWGENELASILSGTNVMDRISNAVSDYWATEYTKILISACKGVFKGLSDHVNDISDKSGKDALFNTSDAIDTKFILGDASDNITAVAVNSMVYAFMLKNDQIENIPASDGKGTIPTYRPLMARVIVDDAVPYSPYTKTGSMYMYGAGAFGFVESTANIVATEIARSPFRGMGDNALINRKEFVLHPLGVQWDEPTEDIVSPTNAGLATGARWKRVKEKKNVYLAEFRFKIEVDEEEPPVEG